MQAIVHGCDRRRRNMATKRKVDRVLRGQRDQCAGIARGRSRGASLKERLAPMLTIGKLAALTDVRTDTLRYYEREHLLAPASKSDSGYRLYDSDSVRRVRFIKRAQHCGFTLAEIAQLLALRLQALLWRCA